MIPGWTGTVYCAYWLYVHGKTKKNIMSVSGDLTDLKVFIAINDEMLENEHDEGYLFLVWSK